MTRKSTGFLYFLSFFLLLVGCDTKTKNVNSCGDNFIDPGEECDGTNLQEQTCASLGHYNLTGTLVCRSDCQFDRTSCGGRCGDGDVDSGNGEECDGSDLNGNSCQSLGYGGGVLGCTVLCQYDKTGCTNACGNGYVEGEEACDDGNNREMDGCHSDCTIEEGWSCDDANPSHCTTVCLDGLVVGEEECDTTNLNGRTCQSLGYYGGELECNFSCTFEMDACEAEGRCGDALLQATYNEMCDGDNLAGQTCLTLGYQGGVLSCAPDCSDFDLSNCTLVNECGDGAVQSGNGEVCDGENLNGQSCVTRGYYEGTLACLSHCMAFDETQCRYSCGDATIQAAYGEVCDGANLAGETCQSRGYYSGTLACNSNCTGFNVTGCAGYCGDSSVQTANNEVCDGNNLNSQTCVFQGYYGGTLTCSTNCLTFGLAGCISVGRCGDDTIQAGYGEICDNYNLNGQTCSSRGYYGGALACGSTCTAFNETACAAVGKCGDGAIQASYGEVCDGANMNGETCETRGYYGGTLACNPNCLLFTTTDCASVGRCGDGIVQTAFGEECDGADLNGETCADAALGLPYGALACGSDCRLVTTGCRADFVTLVDVPGGTFQRDATPTNLSTVSAFRMSETEITREQFSAVMGVDPSNLSYSTGVNDPVQMVRWYAAIAFCNKLSLLEGKTPVYTVSGVDFATLDYAQIPTVNDATWNAATANWAADGYRLPTEMEWMWAAMGADTANPGVVNTTGYLKAFAGSTGSNLVDDYVWYADNSSGTKPVGTKFPNELGLYDMSGNVMEWCWDWYVTYPVGAVTDYRGETPGTTRIRRGGSYSYSAGYVNVIYRGNSNPYMLNYNNGFRVVRP
ncbi:SUMF1/EgtB/PvdO family nonheme iron enzyme [Myxococcota bacterium]|nr:SUMF1/EgtB/PvdO family nonheme iron enzyme [Myxococcota bacterium]